jgi:hypothetical protein
VNSLSEWFPWPDTKPDLPYDGGGWLHPQTASLLSRGATTIVEIGTWLGLSTRYMLDVNPRATVVCIDTWLGSFEHFGSIDPRRIRTLYEGFLVDCWEYRSRIIPVRLDSANAIKLVKSQGVEPSFVYLDGGHQYEVVSQDIRNLTAAWPKAPIILDDYIWPGPTQACAESGREVEVLGYAATLLP